MGEGMKKTCPAGNVKFSPKRFNVRLLGLERGVAKSGSSSIMGCHHVILGVVSRLG